MHMAEDKPKVRQAGHTPWPPAAGTITQWTFVRGMLSTAPMLEHISCLYLLDLLNLACQSQLKKLKAAEGGLVHLLETRAYRLEAFHGQGKIHP